jgi:CRISPR/Cas system-associated protein Cas10 (large subunit of type III CRISPR-Cas system)
MTISCGVAIATANYPFYLLLDLAEALLKNAKGAGSRNKQMTEHYRAPAYVDFHVVAGASSHDLKQVRTDDYFVTERSSHATIRPMPREQLLKLRQAVSLLQRFPRSKLHDLWVAALHKSHVQAQRLVREIFSRSKADDRAALWNAVELLCPDGQKLDFPWYKQGDGCKSAVADLVEAFDLFPRTEDA